jgi:hypothetical protein
MEYKMKSNLKHLAFLLTYFFFSPLVNAQFTESFDNVNTLSQSGWEFINNSDAPSSDDWSQGVAKNFPAQAGASNSYIVNTTATTAGEVVCNWLIMPNIGPIEQLSFYTRSQNNPYEITQMKVMYSPSDNFATGGCSNAPAKTNNKGSLDFGDFETLLTINPNQNAGEYPQDWTQYTVDVNGSGRIAFLYFVNTGSQNFNSGTLAIDTISISNSAVVSAPQAVPTLNFFGLTSLLLIILLISLLNKKHFKMRETQ